MDEDRCARCGETSTDRYCPACGLDRTPAEPVLFANPHRLAQDRERQWLLAHPAAVTVKTCPDCAEQVQAAARICRYCGHKFDTASAGAGASPPPVSAPRRAAAEKSPAGATVLGLLLAGLGHFYIGEIARGVLILGSVLAVAVGLALLDSTATVLGIALLIATANDARRGAHAINDGAQPRKVTGPMWAALGVAVTVLIIGLAADPGGGSTGGLAGSGRLDPDEVEASISPELQRQLQDRVPDGVVSVDSVDCVAADERGGSCLAAVSDSLGNDTTVSITFTVDRTSGEMLWHTDE